MTISSTMRVFVVDDESVISSTLAAILNKSGFAAVPFVQPKKALESAQSDPPDLLISDVMMPGMTGVELAKRILACSPHTRVLLFSGQAATSDLLEAARNEGYDFQLLSKPIHPTDLLAAIRLATNATAAP